jgi:RNA polymerase sigma-70 factor, ECF subfamily
MFERIAKFRRQPSDELFAIDHLPGSRGGRAASPGSGRDWARFTPLLQRHGAAVVHFLYRMVQDRAVAEGLAMEVFLGFYRSTGERSGPAAPPATRLFGMATDLALKELADKNGQPPPAKLADVFEDARHVAASMPGKQRAALLMHKYHRMDTWQIAKALGCSEPLASSLLLSAYAQLRGRLAPCKAPHDLNCTAHYVLAQ